MKNKLLISILFISGMLLPNDAFAFMGIKNLHNPFKHTNITQEEVSKDENVSENMQQEGQAIDELKTSAEIKEAEIQKDNVVSDNNNEEKIFIENIDYTNDVHSEFSLEDCISIALKHNLSIQSSTVNQSIYKQNIGLAWSDYFPELSAGIDWKRARDYGYGNYTTSYLPTVSADMTVFDFGKAKAYADSAKSTYSSKVLDTSERINQIICNTKRAYYNLLFAKAQYEVYTDTVKDFELQKEQAFSLYSAGKKAKVDVAIADYNLCKAKLNFEKAKNVLAVAKYELSHVMGYPEYTNYDLTSDLGQDTYSITSEEAVNVAFKVRPDLLSAEKQTEAAKLNLRAHRRELAPDLKLKASYGNNVGNNSYGSYGFGVNLTYSNFNILRDKKLINIAKYEYEKSKIDLDEKKHDLFLEVNKSYENFKTAESSIAIAKSALDQAYEQYRQTKGRYKAGVADAIELKDGENAYLNARLDYYNSLLNYNVSVAEFEKEIGAPLNNYLNKSTQ